MAQHDDDAASSRPPADPDHASTVSRRDFLKTVGGAGVAGGVVGAGPQTPQPVERRPETSRAPVNRPYIRIREEVAENLIKRGLVGYADRLRVQPGESIRFMVSSEPPRYRADIVRLIHGDANPKGPGIKEVVVETPANGDYSGKRQELPMG